MSSITRFNPNSDAFDDLFRGFFMRPVRFEGQPEMQIKIDVNEGDSAYQVRAEIPGVKKEDIQVNICESSRYQCRDQKREGNEGWREAVA